MSQPDEMTILLRKALVRQSLIEESVIEDLLQHRDMAVDAAKKEIQGTCYLIDYQEKKLKIFDTYTENVFHSIDLPGNPADFNADDFAAWGNSAAIIDPLELQKDDDIHFYTEGNFGLVVKDNKSYLYNPHLDRQLSLGLTNQYIYGARPKKAKANLPYDMYFSDDYSLLCLANRDEGKVHLFDTKTARFTGEIAVRNPGSNKAINLAISISKDKIYITDNISPVLIVYDMFHKMATKKNLGIGVLGNLCLAPDEESIFLIITKPDQNLKQLELENYTETKSFPPKGELFSMGDDPCDLLVISPDKNYIFSMTFINDPEPFTPVITVIDIEKNKAVKRFSIKDETKPINLCFKDINPIGYVNKSLEEILIENGLFSFGKLANIKNAILSAPQAEDQEEITEPEEKAEENTEAEDQPFQFVSIESEIPENTHSGLVPKKVKHVIIPTDARRHIIEILLGSFWQKHEIDLSELPEEKQKLEEVAENVRKKLEYYDMEIVEVKGFYKNKLALSGIISREYILEMLDEEESNKRQTVKTAPSNCPNCGAPMLGSWECTTCGFFLEKPEDALRRKLASADHLANLQKGHFFILDATLGELFEVDQYRVPVWRVSKDDIGLKSITAALRLENMNTLIMDSEAGDIVEITPKGRTAWKFNMAEASKALNHPGSFTILHSAHLLIADSKNQRVMEIDLDGNIIWQYGTYGESGTAENFLNNPTYIQKTYDETFLITDRGNHRVLELSRNIDPISGKYEMRIDWKYGNALNVDGGGSGSGDNELKAPVMAIKDLSGNFLILDSGNNRVIEVNEKKSINWKYNTDISGAAQITNPTRVTRLKNKDLLIIGEGKYVQIIPSAENKVTWVTTPAELAARTNFRIVKEDFSKVKVAHGTSSRYMRKFGEAREEYEFSDKKEESAKRITHTRYMGKVGDSPTDEETQISATEVQKEKELRAIIEEKRKSAINNPVRQEGEKPVAFLTTGETVLPMPIILIDKIDSKVMLANREAHIIWSYGGDEEEKLIRIQTAEITPDRSLLIATAKGLIEIDMKSKKKIWEHDLQAESASRLKNGNTLIADDKTFRVIEITREKEIIWEHFHEDRSAIPSNATRLPNGNTLITYSTTHIVNEVTPDHKVVWSFGEFKKSANDDKHLWLPEYATRLRNGNTLIADSKNARVIEVSPEGEIVWSYDGTSGQKLISPSFASRLKDDHIYIVHASNRQVLEVDHSGKVIWKLILPLKH
jgi:hypothetical protein